VTKSATLVTAKGVALVNQRVQPLFDHHKPRSDQQAVPRHQSVRRQPRADARRVSRLSGPGGPQHRDRARAGTPLPVRWPNPPLGIARLERAAGIFADHQMPPRRSLADIGLETGKRASPPLAHRAARQCRQPRAEFRRPGPAPDHSAASCLSVVVGATRSPMRSGSASSSGVLPPQQRISASLVRQ
jgi:hypothetical protein